MRETGRHGLTQRHVTGNFFLLIRFYYNSNFRARKCGKPTLRLSAVLDFEFSEAIFFRQTVEFDPESISFKSE